MHEQALDSLLHIAIEGPSLNSFPVIEAVTLRASKKNYTTNSQFSVQYACYPNIHALLWLLSMYVCIYV